MSDEEIKPEQIEVVTKEELTSSQLLGTTPGKRPEDIAAELFFLYHNKWEALVDNLSYKALRRLIKKLVTFPLSKKFHHTSEEEKNAYLIGDRLIESLYIMKLTAAAEATDRQLAESEEAKQEIVNEAERLGLNDDMLLESGNEPEVVDVNLLNSSSENNEELNKQGEESNG